MLMNELKRVTLTFMKSLNQNQLEMTADEMKIHL